MIEAHLGLEFFQAGQAVSSLSERSYTVVSAIGKPGSFEDLLKLHQVSLGRHFIYSDHHRFTPDEARQWGEDTFICTEKDCIKIRKIRKNYIVAELKVDLKNGAEWVIIYKTAPGKLIRLLKQLLYVSIPLDKKGNR